MLAALEAVYPTRYLVEAEAGVEGVDFVFKQKIERPDNGTTRTSYRVFGITTGDWVKVKKNSYYKVSNLWFGYNRLIDSATVFVEKKYPSQSAEIIRKEAQKMVSDRLNKEFPIQYSTMNNCANYLVTEKDQGVPDWKKMDNLAGSLAGRFGMAPGAVTLIVVTDGDHAPSPSKQGLYVNDIQFEHVDSLVKMLNSLECVKDLSVGVTDRPPGAKVTQLTKMLEQNRMGTSTSIVAKADIDREV